MAIRNLLHKSHIEEFKQFLDANEIRHRPGRGDFQVLQIEMGDGYWSGTWQSVFYRVRGDHFTVPNPLRELVVTFYRNRRGK